MLFRSDLTGSAAEGQAVAARLGAHGWAPVTHLSTADATRAAVLEGLASADLFHFAGHGRFAGAAGWDSALLLADGGQLDAADLLALRRAPPFVVLSGCETARTVAGAEAPGLDIGLAQAFVLAGAHVALAAARTVSDADTRALFERFYDAWQPGEPPGPAFGAAVSALRAARPTADAGAFRLFVP